MHMVSEEEQRDADACLNWQMIHLSNRLRLYLCLIQTIHLVVDLLIKHGFSFIWVFIYCCVTAQLSRRFLHCETSGHVIQQ